MAESIGSDVLEKSSESSRKFSWKGKNLRKLHYEYREKILALLLEKKRPMNIEMVVEETGISYPTATQTLQELALEGKLRYFRVGNSKCFEINTKGIAGLLNEAELEVK